MLSEFESVVLSGSSGSSVAETFRTSFCGITVRGDAGKGSHDRIFPTMLQLGACLKYRRSQLQISEDRQN